MQHAWLAPSTRRFYPSSPGEPDRHVRLDAARGERIAFQAVFRTGERESVVSAAVTAPETFMVTVRRVGYVPVDRLTARIPADDLDGIEHLPGPAPDPLFPEATVHAGPFETHSFWITLTVPVDGEPASHPVQVTLRTADGVETRLSAVVDTHRAVLAPRRNFPVTNWFYADALSDRYQVEPFSDAFWRILRPYLQDYAGHGADTVYVPMITPSLDGVKRPTQLLGVHRETDDHRFDWTLVRRWVRECQAQGITRFEWSHLFTQWGAAHAPRVYEGHGADRHALWDDRTAATSAVYTGFLSRLLPELERFLTVEGLHEHSYFHLSDEPDGDEALANYRTARGLVRRLAPWMRVMDALSDIRFAAEGLIDVPIPIVSTAPDFLAQGHAAWTYFCTEPRGRYVNRLIDTPLPNLRMLGWLLYRTGAKGFLHWGYNYWYRHLTTELVDPYRVTDGGGSALPSGDAFVVYPGDDGPVDSLRWEVFSESMQDLALLQHSGLAPDHPLLTGLRDFADFPRDREWLVRSRRGVLSAVAESQSSG